MTKPFTILTIIFFVALLVVPANISFASDTYSKKNKSISQNKSLIMNNSIIIRLRKNDIPPQDLLILLKSVDNSITINNQLIKLEESITYNYKLRQTKSQNKNINIQKILETESPLLRTFILKFSSEIEPEKLCQKILQSIPSVEIAEPVYHAKVLQFLPNDPISAQQTLLSTCKVREAWEYATGDSNLIIGISDNGCYQHHEDLKNSIAKNWADPVNGIDDDGNG
ncbi:hypothetical protein D9V86_04745, partial [Bacteroidetes/Chlorobi group bacterium ChocPot_Mid]